MNFGTKLIHASGDIDPATGSVSTPIYQTSTFHQFDIDNFGKYDYSRSGNPTRDVLEKLIAELEGGERGFAFASGMAAIASVLSIFSAGDHIIICGDVYGGTYRAATKLFSRFNIDFTFVDASNIEEIRSAFKENTRGLYLETPSNPLLKVTDLRAASRIANEHNAITIVDNTFMSPYLQRPLELGADIVVHSATKFLGGHSDVLAGLVVTKTKELSDRVYQVQNTFGAVLGPQDSWLLIRGIKTLKVRLDALQKSAQKLAEWLEGRDEVEKVYYLGLESMEGRNLHLEQAYGAGAVLSFKFKDIERTTIFLNNVKNVAVAVSLGSVETIVSYPAKMSHAAIPKEEREQLGITDTLIRVSVGLEDIDDLLGSFQEAIEK
ncbi:cystathionine beta-lyase [Clostridium saccharobutylicum]|uniref:trans-sulfuration enzyme family protein n=1 Tax=Clostridium saccharobutylicum TaxID=169679 RepID=UPI000983D659|nr:aminotransferase class I/II-fold pyridoxal phosphate-dependent enzyme [Clostridium saccharobutylicum]AQS08232.1 cystathionine beta-lyase [Clostridium saccharobutylicum]MBC2435880.1 aminotransferase class I/II-fold pyridoxal phosphate-dependent enzyme [Clostridium saccharobutylicum]NSB89054.1 cystathionine beta-lyase [Clostridium saccharobutylicum]NYC29446.1 cystathionine beta-lyase [Clostridium saccharobutylicum]OOM11545.1 cystathionine beta-lyase [Clostridium saccharobutylicum]